MKIVLFNKLFLNALIIFIPLLSPALNAQDSSLNNSEIELFPILNYDSDAGFGYGGKAFLYNQLDHNESFDITLYNSTKGERWYRFAYSFPDIERRQGKSYPFAIDIILDYDKWISYRYYGVEYFYHRDSLFDYETYTREPFEISAIFSRGFTDEFIVSAGLKYKTISSYNFNKNGELLKFDSYFNKRYIKTVSFLTTIKWDGRNSFINPDNGIVVQLDAEYAPELSFTNEDYFKLRLYFSKLYFFIYSQNRNCIKNYWSDNFP